MSHANGLAILPDGRSYHYEYDGTSDICCTRLYDNTTDLYENWRKDNLKECADPEHERIKVILTTDYGYDHFLWFSTICEICMCITGKRTEQEGG